MNIWTILYVIFFICVTPFVFAAVLILIFNIFDINDSPDREEWENIDW
jgi:hypothetical protein